MRISMSMTLATIVVAGLLSGGDARAAECGDRVAALAREQGLSATPPTTGSTAGDDASGAAGGEAEQGVVTSRELGRSGGVIEPPAAGETPVMEPPASGDAMTTAPRIAPQTAGRAPDMPAPGESERINGRDARVAVVEAQVEALLTAARAASERGNEQECLDRLDAARAMMQEGSAR